MQLRDISIKWKLSAPIILLIIMGVAISTVVTGYKTEAIVLHEVEDSTLEGYRDTILNTLTTMMLANNIRETRGPFIEQMQHFVDLKVLRSENVDKDMGKGDAKDYDEDALDKEVLETGKERIVVEGETIRGVFPYIARENFMGRNCLSCHNVKEGTVLGAISIKVPLKDSFSRIKKMQYLYGLFGLIGIVVMSTIVVFLVNITHAPMKTLIEKVRTGRRRLYRHVPVPGRERRDSPNVAECGYGHQAFFENASFHHNRFRQNNARCRYSQNAG